MSIQCIIVTYRASVAVVYGERESWQQRDDYAALPRRSLAMGPDDTMHECISNSVLDLHLIHNRTACLVRPRWFPWVRLSLRSDEKLVLNIHEMV